MKKLEYVHFCTNAGGGLSPLFLLITYLPYQSLSSMFFGVLLTHLLSNAPAIFLNCVHTPDSPSETLLPKVHSSFALWK